MAGPDILRIHVEYTYRYTNSVSGHSLSQLYRPRHCLVLATEASSVTKVGAELQACKRAARGEVISHAGVDLSCIAIYGLFGSNGLIPLTVVVPPSVVVSVRCYFSNCLLCFGFNRCKLPRRRKIERRASRRKSMKSPDSLHAIAFGGLNFHSRSIVFGLDEGAMVRVYCYINAFFCVRYA